MNRGDAPSLRESPEPTSGPTFADRLKSARALSRMTQAAVARSAGLNVTLVAHYEGGDREPSLGNLRKLGRSLNVTADYLLGLQEPTTPSNMNSPSLRLCGYCRMWNSRPCGEGCGLSVRDPTWEQVSESPARDGAPHKESSDNAQ